jgi:hypothetical protein
MLENGVSEVGLVCHEDDRTVWFGRDREIEVGMAGGGIVKPADPEAASITLNGDVLIYEIRSVVFVENFDDGGGVKGHVVIAQGRVARGSIQVGKNLGAATERVAACDKSERAVGDEVAREKNKVGRKRVDFVNDAFEKKGLGVLVKMDVTELDDPITVKRCGQIRNSDGPFDNIDLVTSDLAGVECQSGCGRAGAYKKFSTAEL